MNQWKYDPSANLSKSISEKLTVFPRERDMTCFIARSFWSILLRVVLKIYFRLEIIGKENLPQDKSCVIVSNHSSHLDALCLLSVLPLRSINRVFAVAAKDYFFCSFFKSLLAVVCVNALPFDRKKQKKKSLELCADVLDAADKILVMFPEGSRSVNGKINAFKPGLGLLVAGTNRLVVPSYINGGYEAWAKGSHFPKPKKIIVTIGKPMNFCDMKKSKENYRIIAKKVEDSVRNLNERGQCLS